VWLLFPENIGKRLSIDETSLSNGELYTILTNKANKGKKGTIVAMVAGTKAETVIAIIEKIPLRQRNLVEEITLDMAGNMGLIAKKCFLNATRVTDRFTLIFYLNFGSRDTASLNSRSKTSFRGATRN
jgi:transposase